MAKVAAAGENKKQEAASKARKEAKQKKEAKPRSSLLTGLMIAIPLILVFAVFVLVILPTLTVPFSTFKSNFASAKRVAIIASYNVQAGSGATLECATQAVQVAAHSRNATTIDFYVINQTSCLESVGGLGHVFTPAANTISNCLNSTKSETSLFLNYSATNDTLITPYKLYIYGNIEYMNHCPIAVDLS